MNLLIVVTDVLEKIVLLGLLGLSVWSIAIMIDRHRKFKIHLGDPPEDLQRKIQAKAWMEISALSENTFVVSGLKVALEAKTKNSEVIERMVSSYVKLEKSRLESGLLVLATLGSNAPFIGLFGTVLGIIRAFAYLSAQSNPGAVMSGVSQALYATAFGLFVAIPAVVAFNYFSSEVKRAIVLLESYRDLLVAKIIEDSPHGQ